MGSPTETLDHADEKLKSPLPRPMGRNDNAGGGADADVESHATPDADADRDAPASPDQDKREIKKPALETRQIEDIEDDAMGG